MWEGSLVNALWFHSPDKPGFGMAHGLSWENRLSHTKGFAWGSLSMASNCVEGTVLEGDGGDSNSCNVFTEDYF